MKSFLKPVAAAGLTLGLLASTVTLVSAEIEPLDVTLGGCNIHITKPFGVGGNKLQGAIDILDCPSDRRVVVSVYRGSNQLNGTGRATDFPDGTDGIHIESDRSNACNSGNNINYKTHVKVKELSTGTVLDEANGNTKSFDLDCN